MTEATPANPNPSPAPSPTSWTTGLEAEFVGHAQNKGWDKLAPDAAAREAIKAHRHAELSLGVPADRVLKLPAADAKPEDWNPVYQRLGAPKEAKEYDFSTVKDKAGNPLDADLLEALRAASFENHLSKAAAAALAQKVSGWTDAQGAKAGTIDQAKIAEEKAALRDSWGKFYDARIIVAKQVAEKFGFTGDMLDVMEGQAGFAKVMKALSDIGSAIGEDRFINPGKAANGAMTKEQAIARKAELFSDSGWVGNAKTPGSYLGGDATKNQEFMALLKIIAGDA